MNPRFQDAGLIPQFTLEDARERALDLRHLEIGVDARGGKVFAQPAGQRDQAMGFQFLQQRRNFVRTDDVGQLRQ